MVVLANIWKQLGGNGGEASCYHIAGSQWCEIPEKFGENARMTLTFWTQAVCRR